MKSYPVNIIDDRRRDKIVQFLGCLMGAWDYFCAIFELCEATHCQRPSILSQVSVYLV